MEHRSRGFPQHSKDRKPFAQDTHPLSIHNPSLSNDTNLSQNNKKWNDAESRPGEHKTLHFGLGVDLCGGSRRASQRSIDRSRGLQFCGPRDDARSTSSASLELLAQALVFFYSPSLLKSYRGEKNRTGFETNLLSRGPVGFFKALFNSEKCLER